MKLLLIIKSLLLSMIISLNIFANDTQVQVTQYSADVSGDPVITKEEQDKCLKEANYSVCISALKAFKRVQIASGAPISESQPVVEKPIGQVELRPDQNDQPSTELVGDNFWNGLSASDDEICKKAFAQKIVRSIQKCISNLSSDKKEKFDVAREIHFGEIEKKLKEEKEALIENCNKNVRGFDKRKECREKAKQDILTKKRGLKRDYDIAYAIAKSKANEIEEEYEKEFKAKKLEVCGRRPVDDHSSATNAQLSVYRKCVKEEKQKFSQAKDAQKNKRISELQVSDKDYESVKAFCNKGAFDFFTDKYDDCIQYVLKENAFKELAETNKNKQQKPIVDDKEDTQEKINCEDLALKEIDELLQSDQENILGKLYQITSLKIAKQVVHNMGQKSYPNASLESLITDQKKYYSTEQAKKLVDIYQKNGRIFDAQFIEDNIVKNPVSYNKKSQRLDNDNISAYLLADIYSNPETTSFNELDAATAWFMDRVREKSQFSENGSSSNLLNMSVIVYRNVNMLAGSEADSIERIDRIVAEQELKIKDLMNSLKSEVERKLVSQCGKYFESPCWDGEVDTFSNKIAKSFMKLGQNINSLDIKPSLTGTINGKYKFNFLEREFLR